MITELKMTILSLKLLLIHRLELGSMCQHQVLRAGRGSIGYILNDFLSEFSVFTVMF